MRLLHVRGEVPLVSLHTYRGDGLGRDRDPCGHRLTVHVCSSGVCMHTGLGCGSGESDPCGSSYRDEGSSETLGSPGAAPARRGTDLRFVYRSLCI